MTAITRISSNQTDGRIGIYDASVHSALGLLSPIRFA